MDDLTPLQYRILGAIRRRSLRGEPPPTYRDLCAEFGWASTGTARDHLQALARKGHLDLGHGLARKLRLKEAAVPPAISVRIIGEVAAGIPVAAEQLDLGVVPAPQTWGAASKLFALRVCGTSMRDSGILDGDLVVVRRQSNASDGAIVVATLGGETTLKRLGVCSDRAMLLPENPAFKPIAIGEDGVAIQGVVVGLLRGLNSTHEARASRAARSSSEIRRGDEDERT